MKPHIIAVASLTLLAAVPASARYSAPPWNPHAAESTGGTAFGSPASVAHADTDCRTFSNYHARQRCQAINGVPDSR